MKGKLASLLRKVTASLLAAATILTPSILQAVPAYAAGNTQSPVKLAEINPFDNLLCAKHSSDVSAHNANIMEVEIDGQKYLAYCLNHNRYGSDNVSGGAVGSSGYNVQVYDLDDPALQSIDTFKNDKDLMLAMQGVISDAPKTVTVKPGETVEVIFQDDRVEEFTIRKVGSDGKPIGGVTFVISTLAGAEVARVTTGSDGLAVLTDIQPGSYKVQEVSVPDGVILDTTPQTVEVVAGKPTTLTFVNDYEGGLRIIKTVTQTGKALKGVTFRIEKPDGGLIGEYTTDEQGQIFVSLEPQTVVVREISAPEGYSVDSTPRTVEIKANDITTLTYKDERLNGIRIRKVDADTGRGIYGVRIMVTDENNDVVGVYTTDHQGYIEIDKELSDGVYYLEEIEAAPGYDLDKVVKRIRIENGKTKVIVWENAREKGQIQILKTSADANPVTGQPAGSRLEGAVFEIARADTDRVVGYMVSDYRGVAASEPLPLGKYVVREVTPPAFYQLNSREFTVELKVQNDVVRVEVQNSSAQISTSVKKSGNNLLHLINKYMDLYKADPKNLAAKAKSEKYAKILAKTLINTSGEDSAQYGQNAFFYDSAEGLLAAMFLLVAEYLPSEDADGNPIEQRHIVSVFKLVQELLVPSRVKGKNQFQLLLEKLPENHKAKWFAGSALNTAEQAMASVLSTVLSRLNAFLDSEMEQILCFGTAIDAEAFCNEKSAIFIVLPEEDQTKYFMVSLILQNLYREILTVADENGGRLKNRVVFFADELGTCPPIQSLELMFSASRSRGLMLVPIVQSITGQLQKNYGREGAEIIVDIWTGSMFIKPTRGIFPLIRKRVKKPVSLRGRLIKKHRLQMMQMPMT